MSAWFPDVSEPEGISGALQAGFFGSLAFAAMLVLGVAFVVFTDTLPNSGGEVEAKGGAILGMLIELSVVLTAAWRFKRGKGLVWGGAILLLFVFETVGKVASGTTNVGWIIFYAAVFVGLVNGVRGAWAKRRLVEVPEEVFE